MAKRGPLMRTTPDTLETIASRHTPTMIEAGTDNGDIGGVLVCSRGEQIIL